MEYILELLIIQACILLIHLLFVAIVIRQNSMLRRINKELSRINWEKELLKGEL